jgi:glucan phosphoethanolaminetransferase (alkaline phosphatase superfamily)
MGLQEEINRLKADNQALHQEFSHEPTSPDKIKKQLAELVPDALTQLSHLLNHAESESVRASAAKYVIDLARTSSSTDDAISKLINDLKQTPTGQSIDTPNP